MDGLIDQQLTGRQYVEVVKRRQCCGSQLPYLFRDRQLLDRLVVAFTPAVEAEDLASTALCCVSYGLSDSTPNVTTVTTAGFSFVVGECRYIATRLHGRSNSHNRHMSALPPAVLLADAFRSDDSTLLYASQVGHVVCDWRNQHGCRPHTTARRTPGGRCVVQ